MGKGNVLTSVMESGNTKKCVKVKETLFVPDSRTNLISAGKVTDGGHSVIFDKNKAEIVNSDKKVLLTAEREKDLYYFKSVNNPVENFSEANAISAPEKNSFEDWHYKMGHLNTKSLQEAIRTESIQGIQIKGSRSDFECRVCPQGKMCCPPFPKASVRKTNIGELIHSDVCGPMRVNSDAGNRYFVTFIDDFSRRCVVKFLKQKNQALSEFEKFTPFVKTQQGKKIKCLRSDNSTECENKSFNELLQRLGISRELTAPYNPEQNNVSERQNKTLMETARCRLIQSNLPLVFWAEAVYTANFIRNRSPSSKLNRKTPYELWYGEPPDVSNFKRFGCEVFVMDRALGKSKLEPRATKGIFIGYSSESKVYRIWICDEKKIVISRDVKFFERSLSTDDQSEVFCEQSDSLRDLKQIHDNNEISRDKQTMDINICDNQSVDEDIHEPTNNLEELGEDFLGFPGVYPIVPEENRENHEIQETPVRRGRRRAVRTGRRGRPRLEFVNMCSVNNNEDESSFLLKIPVTKALREQNSHEWMQAMSSEVKSILENDTWDMIDRPKDTTPIGSRFILCKKYGTNGALDKKKARIVAKGYAQTYGKDFHETYAPVARISSVRTTLAIAIQKGMHIQQLDVTTAYLNGKLTETVYMEFPDYIEDVLQFIVSDKQEDKHFVQRAQNILVNLEKGDKVCLMKRAIYGLKQAGQAWYTRLNEELQNLGMKPTSVCVREKFRSEKYWKSRKMFRNRLRSKGKWIIN